VRFFDDEPTGAIFPSTQARSSGAQLYFASTRRPNQAMQRNETMEKRVSAAK
jgi:hypothetical protein